MKPRALVVTFNRLFPADQGNARRTLQMVAEYQRLGYEVDLLYHNDEGHDLALAAQLEAHFGRVRVVASRVSKRIHPEHVCHIADWYDKGLEPVALDMHRLRGYRLVHVNYIWYAPLLRCFGSGVIKVLDSHDIFADRAAKYRAAGMAPNWFSTTLAEEDRALRLADVVLAIQRDEARELAARGNRNVLSLPYVEPRVCAFGGRMLGPRPVLGYIGSQNDWNIRSMTAFMRALRQASEAPPFQLLVAGAICRHVREAPGVVSVGPVGALQRFYDSIDLALNPMVGGTGLKIKTVEPLCHGKPVLTTPAGAQGLSHLWQLPCFETPAAMVAYLLGEFSRSPASALQSLALQGEASRSALESEYQGQLGRFSAWLLSRPADQPQPPAKEAARRR